MSHEAFEKQIDTNNNYRWNRAGCGISRSKQVLQVGYTSYERSDAGSPGMEST